MAVPCRPDPPIIGKVTHHSIGLYWEEPPLETDDDGNQPKESAGRIRYCIQEDDSTRTLHPKGFGTVYTGFARSCVLDGLDTQTKYRYRLRAGNNNGNSDWSPCVDVSTTKKPITGEELHKAISHQEKDTVFALLEENKTIVDIPDRYGLTPLMNAAQKGYYEICEILIANNADINYKNTSGKTCIMLACFMGHGKIVRLLLKNGADLTIVDNGGSTALHWAVDGSHVDVVRYLLENGAKVEERDAISGWTPLMRAAATGGNIRVARVLVEYGGNVNVKDAEGKSILMIAVINGSEDIVRVLLENNVQIDYKNEYGKTAMDFAHTFDRRRITELLDNYKNQLSQAN